MKKLLPYIITVIVFCLVFVLTQVIDEHIWRLDFSPSISDIENNHKTDIQAVIFVICLSMWLSILSLLKRVKREFSRMRSRIWMNLATITFIYSFNFGLSKFIKSGGFNIYYDWRANLGIPLALVTFVISSVSLFLISLLLEVIEIIFLKINKNGAVKLADDKSSDFN